jgi:acyl-CoA synthetase (AMP-forming)/AMP-acid ligase II
VTGTVEWNFAGRLVERLGPGSCLTDAAAQRTICAKDLPRLVAAYGAAFLSAGLRKGDRVLIGCSLTPSTALAYLGAMYAGLVAVPVEDREVRESAARLLEVTGAKAVWTETKVRAGENDRGPVCWLQGELAQGELDPGELDQGELDQAELDQEVRAMMPPAECVAGDLAALMSTSGTTCVPLFVMVTHGNLIANTEAIIRSQGLASDDRAMLVLPLSYCFGASVLHTHLYQGGGVVLDRRFMFPDKVLHAIGEFNCTTFAGVPTVYNVLLRRSNIRRFAMPGLRRFLQAGGALIPQRISEIRAAFPSTRFYVMYGQTEATARISCMEPERWEEKRGSVGPPLDNLTVSIVDEDGNDLPAGQVGELRVKGPSVGSGYWNDPEETRRVYSDSWLRTGDLARQDEEGYLWIEARKGAFVKMRGIRVSFAEAEARVMVIPGVYECAAHRADHPEAGEALVLYVVPDEGAQISEEEIRRHLPAHWVFDSIRMVSELPKTSTGKIAISSLMNKAKTCARTLEDKIERLLSTSLYSVPPEEKQVGLLAILKEELDNACERHPSYKNYVQQWPTDYRIAGKVADLPFLPVAMLKANPPLSLVGADEITKTVTSSATTSQVPSRVVLDSKTARRTTKGIVAIVRDFIGPARRPYLVVDTPGSMSGTTLGARGAAIQGLQPFASETTYCLDVDAQGELVLDRNKLQEFAENFANKNNQQDAEVLVYGFTFVLWNHLVSPLLEENICLNLRKAWILHSGGWKRLQDQAVEKSQFNKQLAQVFGCPVDRVIDFYGMVEAVGVIYPDCCAGNKHAPAFGDVIVRNPLTLEPAASGEEGIVQVCNALPTSFPGNLLLTDDMARVIAYDGCPCGRRGISFRFTRRIPEAENRGCGNIQIKRSPLN